MKVDIYTSGRPSPRLARLYRRYANIMSDCALVTATDGRHAPYLFNAMASIHARFPDHPVLHVFDLGMSRAQIAELAAVPWVRLKPMDHFVEHWKLNWSWKPYILTQVPQRYVFYFDASNIVLYRPLVIWFEAIANKGYFLIENGQKMKQTVPPEYWSLFGCDENVFSAVPTFGAGLMGYDRQAMANDAIAEVLKRTKEGWNLGRSAGETRMAYDRSVIRDCECFRADQTLFNLAFRRRYGSELTLREELRYCGLNGPADHPRQYLWYSRRRRDSLIYFWRPLSNPRGLFLLNRIVAIVRITSRNLAIKLVHFVARIRTREKK